MNAYVTRVKHGCATHGPRIAEYTEQAPSTKGVRHPVLTTLSYNFLTDKSLACNLTFNALGYITGVRKRAGLTERSYGEWGRAIDMLNPPVRVRGSNQFDTQLSQLALELRLGQLSIALCKSTLTNSSAGAEILTTSGFGGCSTNTDRRVPFRTDLDETPVVVERSRWSAIRAAVLAKGVDSPRVEHTQS